MALITPERAPPRIDKVMNLAARAVLLVWRKNSHGQCPTRRRATIWRHSTWPYSNKLCYETENSGCHPSAGTTLSRPDAPQPASDQAPAAGCHYSACAATRATPPQFSPECREDPTGGIEKEAAAEEFGLWYGGLSNEIVTIFSDGTE